MAIYHLSVQIISRGQGRSAVAAAAYRSGERIENEHDGITHDYTAKGGIVHSEIMLPENAPPEWADRGRLWNEVEQTEKQNNAALAREINVALPVELDRQEQVDLIRDYCNDNFVSAGMCCDVNIHDPPQRDADGKVIQHGALGEKYLECAAWQLNQIEAFYSFLLTVPAVNDYLATHNNMKGENTNEEGN